MARPSKYPEWATSGTIIEPASGDKSAGWYFEQFCPFEWRNWLDNLHYLWIQHLDEADGRRQEVVEAEVHATTPAWQASTAYSAGDFIKDSNGGLWRAKSSGTSGSSEPAFPAGPSLRDVVIEGTIEWQFYAGMLCDGAGVSGSQPKVLLSNAAEVTGTLPLGNIAEISGSDVVNDSNVSGSSVTDALNRIDNFSDSDISDQSDYSQVINQTLRATLNNLVKGNIDKIGFRFNVGATNDVSVYDGLMGRDYWQSHLGTITKYIDQHWASGHQAGGLASDISLPLAAGIYWVHLLGDFSTNIIDIGFDDSPIPSSTLASDSGKDAFGPIGFVYWNGTNLIPGQMQGDLFRFSNLVSGGTGTEGDIKPVEIDTVARAVKRTIWQLSVHGNTSGGHVNVSAGGSKYIVPGAASAWEKPITCEFYHSDSFSWANDSGSPVNTPFLNWRLQGYEFNWQDLIAEIGF